MTLDYAELAQLHRKQVECGIRVRDDATTEVRERFAQYFVGDVVISAITLAELEFGVACSGQALADNKAALDSLLEDIVVMPFEAGAVRAYGPLRAAHRDRNKSARDKLIASHAVALNIPLVTNSEADFIGYPGLVIENWVENH